MIILAIVSTIILFLTDYGSVLLANRLNNPNHKGIQCPIEGEFKTLPDIIHNNISTENKLFLHFADYGLNIMGFLSNFFIGSKLLRICSFPLSVNPICRWYL